jgi:hypothetical protein
MLHNIDKTINKKGDTMKHIFILISILLLLFTSTSVFAQTGSDYYLPLKVGNYLKFHTDGSLTGWAARTSTNTVEGIDTISGKVYFREIDSEVADDSSFNNAYNFLWLRKDSAGNVTIGAVGDSANVNSATKVNGYLFPNAFLTKGYSQTYPYGNQTYQDSVISINETVSVPAGSFNNCLEISTTHFDTTKTAVFREYHYYAAGVGLIKNVRTIPDSQIHTDELIAYKASAVTNVSGNAVNQTPQSFSLSQNYPNPFNPSTQISYQVPSNSSVSLKVFDVLGREVATLVNEVKPAGTYTATFNANSFPSGVYFYQLNAGSFSETKKLMLLK